jgi:hypothetical protein
MCGIILTPEPERSRIVPAETDGLADRFGGLKPWILHLPFALSQVLDFGGGEWRSLKRCPVTMNALQVS